MNEHLIHAKGIYNSQRQKYTADALFTQGDRIAAIGGFEELHRRHPQAKVAELTNGYVFPGLINTHVHLEFDASSELYKHYTHDNTELRFLRAAVHANQMLRSGVTTVRDAGSTNAMLALLLPEAQALLPMPRLRLAGAPITVTGGHLCFQGGEADTPEELLAAVGHRKAIGCTDIKIVVSGGQLTPNTHPESVSYSPEEIRVITGEAARFGMPTFAHCLTTDGFVNCMLGGVECIEHCACFVRNRENGLLERVYEADKLEKFRGSGRFFANELSAGYHTFDACREEAAKQTPREAFLLQQEKREMEIFNRYIALGFVPVLGTDAGVSNTPFDETWLELALMVSRCGMRNADAIATGTVNAAQCLHIEQETGCLLPGLCADLIVMDTDPLQDIRAFAHVRQVMKQGQWLEF